MAPERPPEAEITAHDSSCPQRASASERAVGTTGLEPGTSTVSWWRSNQLSYAPSRRAKLPAVQRRRTATSLASRRPCRVSTQRSPRGSTRPSRASPSRASWGTPAVVRNDSCSASTRRVSASSVSPAASVGWPDVDRRDVALRRADVPPAPTGDVRVGRAPEAEVVVLPPVEQVVPALVAGPRPVGHLVVGEARGGEQVVGELVLLGLDVVVGIPGGVGGERRARLDGEAVGGDVRRVELEGVFQRRAPLVQRLGGGAVDEIEVERREPDAPDRLDGANDVVRVVLPTEQVEDPRHHRLHTEADPRHTARGVGGEQARR